MNAYLPPAEWFATLPTVFVSTGALITAEDGSVLLVKASYQSHWGFPGGVIDPGEAPHETVAREVTEEVGLTVEVGAPLVLDWNPTEGERPKPLAYFVFDCGTIPARTPLVLQESEIETAAFVPVVEAITRMDGYGR
ncbi:NUDIX domain-containing protein, partial [Stackebrandtia soli]|uniref:NUDIX domain-containing protein n=1 Tax=Stackebrandtia soli TaxID=1892856 RepID=UPI0039EA8BB4